MKTALLALLSAVLLAAPGSAADLSALAAAAADRSPEATQAQAQGREARAGLSEARAGRLPRLSATSAFLRGNDPVYVFGSLLQQRSFGAQNFAVDALNHPADYNDIKTSLNAGVPLFTGFAISRAVEAGKLGVRQAGLGEDAARQGARWQAVDDALRVLLDTETLSSLDARIASAESELAEADRLKARGLVLGSDFYAAQAVLGSLRAWRLQVQGDLDARRAELSVLTGVPAEDLSVSGVLANAPYDVAASTALVAGALAARPDLALAQVGVSQAELARRQADASVLPTVMAFGSLETNTKDFTDNPWSRLFGVQASLAFGDPGYPARRARARAAQQAAEASRLGAERRILAQVAQARVGYEAALGMLPDLSDTVARARRSLVLFRPLYREGRQSVLEVLRAEEGLAQAQAAYAQALFGLHDGYARLLAAQGRLDAAGVAEIQRHLETSR
ncbi:MAG: TolC family protein [Elusimicrobia bacterium]|nr:TolC family protein [Elusimicrobiota bacterium]